ncbi:MAG: phage holin family protein [Akkermansiaceae bacterium]
MAEEISSLHNNLETDHHSGESPQASVRSAGSSIKNAFSSFLAARTELASIEAKEAAAFAGKKVVFALIAALCLFFVWALMLSALTGLFTPMANDFLAGKADWLPGWVAVLFCLAILHLLVAFICLFLLTKKPSSPLFELSLQEIQNDKQWLKNSK